MTKPKDDKTTSDELQELLELGADEYVHKLGQDITADLQKLGADLVEDLEANGNAEGPLTEELLSFAREHGEDPEAQARADAAAAAEFAETTVVPGATVLEQGELSTDEQTPKMPEGWTPAQFWQYAQELGERITTDLQAMIAAADQGIAADDLDDAKSRAGRYRAALGLVSARARELLAWMQT